MKTPKPAAVSVADLRVVSSPEKNVIGFTFVTPLGQIIAIEAKGEQLERLIIELLAALYEMPGRPAPTGVGHRYNAVRCHSLTAIGEAPAGGALLLDVGPVRLPIVLDQGSIAALGRELTRLGALLGPEQGRA